MNCIDFRREIGSDPQSQSDDILAHRQECAACARYADEMRSMDGLLGAAMRVEVPDGLTDIDALLARAQGGEATANRSRRGWYALAASVLLGIGLVSGLMLGQSRSGGLPSELIAHVLHEPQALRDDLPVLELARVSSVLERGRVALKGDIGDVRYAGLCSFRGRPVPHLVVRGQSGPVTVMLLPDEHVEERTPFDEEGFKGVIVPTGRGSIAIIGEPDELLEPVQQIFSQSVEFSI